MNALLNIVFFACYEKWWDWERLGFVSRTALLARGLAAHPAVRRLLVVDPASNVMRGAPKGGRSEGTTLTPVSDRVHVLDHSRLMPRETVLPASRAINARLHDEALVFDVMRRMDELDMDDAVLWLAGPLVAKYAQRFDDNVVVYDAVDQWLADPGQAHMRRQIAESYDIIRERADVVFAVSPTLAQAFGGARPAVHVVPNGVDVERFCEAHPVPDDVAALPAPRVGYVGVLQNRLDVGLIKTAAEAMPGVSFVFVGPVIDRAHFAPLNGVSNVHFLGPRSFEHVPAYVGSFDACILPHEQSELTTSMDPLKLYEYLAAGKPVVATELPLNQPPDLVRAVAGAEAFVAALAEALDGRWRPSQASLRRYLAEATWSNRVDVVVGHLREASDRTGLSRTLVSVGGA